ncbi:hypothetical protein [Chlorobaculum tepidum]|uniref:hypothetical protein n=1 Tax=Chlorobaculum tepidum TaxID=1097 RepID=UPI0013E8D281|nr:hypothetical protein [Chlorobaculum tepidum]
MVLTVFCFNDRTVDSISPPLGYRLAKQGTAPAADFQSRRIFAKTSDGTFIVTNLFTCDFRDIESKKYHALRECLFVYSQQVVYRFQWYLYYPHQINRDFWNNKDTKKQSFRHPELPVPAKHGLRKRAEQLAPSSKNDFEKHLQLHRHLLIQTRQRSSIHQKPATARRRYNKSGSTERHSRSKKTDSQGLLPYVL